MIFFTAMNTFDPYMGVKSMQCQFQIKNIFALIHDLTLSMLRVALVAQALIVSNLGVLS